MAALSHTIAPEEVVSPWQGFKTGLWQKEINVRDFATLFSRTMNRMKGPSLFFHPQRKGLRGCGID